MAGHRRTLSRRRFLQTAGGTAVAGCQTIQADRSQTAFALNYMLASSMYGKTDVIECIRQVDRIGASCIDLWPPSHGDQRDQIDEIGHDKFVDALKDASVGLEMTTRYDLGPYRLQNEMEIVSRLGGKMIVCGSRAKTDAPLKTQVKDFVESMKPHVAKAETLGVTIAIENHSSALINSPDSLKFFADLSPSPNLGIALAPYHLQQDAASIAALIKHCGTSIVHFYAWEHGLGCHRPMPKPHELMQLPGFGTLDFVPIVRALMEINYQGFTEIFMHPTPRGIPIMKTTGEVNSVINRSANYLSRCIAQSAAGAM